VLFSCAWKLIVVVLSQNHRDCAYFQNGEDNTYGSMPEDWVRRHLLRGRQSWRFLSIPWFGTLSLSFSHNPHVQVSTFITTNMHFSLSLSIILFCNSPSLVFHLMPSPNLCSCFKGTWFNFLSLPTIILQLIDLPANWFAFNPVLPSSLL